MKMAKNSIDSFAFNFAVVLCVAATIAVTTVAGDEVTTTGGGISYPVKSSNNSTDFICPDDPAIDTTDCFDAIGGYQDIAADTDEIMGTCNWMKDIYIYTKGTYRDGRYITTNTTCSCRKENSNNDFSWSCTEQTGNKIYQEEDEGEGEVVKTGDACPIPVASNYTNCYVGNGQTNRSRTCSWSEDKFVFRRGDFQRGYTVTTNTSCTCTQPEYLWNCDVVEESDNNDSNEGEGDACPEDVVADMTSCYAGPNGQTDRVRTCSWSIDNGRSSSDNDAAPPTTTDTTCRCVQPLYYWLCESTTYNTITSTPTSKPSNKPSISSVPSTAPSDSPTISPKPSSSPSANPSGNPSSKPSSSPTTATPTSTPTSKDTSFGPPSANSDEGNSECLPYSELICTKELGIEDNNNDNNGDYDYYTYYSYNNKDTNETETETETETTETTATSFTLSTACDIFKDLGGLNLYDSTIFVPTDDAFERFEEFMIEKSSDNEAMSDYVIFDIIMYHGSYGTKLYDDLICTEPMEMWTGETSRTHCERTVPNQNGQQQPSIVKYQKGGGNNRRRNEEESLGGEPQIIVSDLLACNGNVVHIINEVMLPNEMVLPNNNDNDIDVTDSSKIGK